MSAKSRDKLPSTVQNILSGYFAQAWVIILNLALLPVFVERLGIDAWGIVALLTILHAIFGLLDLGLSPMITREVAYLKSNDKKFRELVDLFHTTRMIFVTTGAAGGVLVGSVGFLFLSQMAAFSKFSDEILQKSFICLGFLCAARFIEVVFRGALFGLERHTLYNAVLLLFTTARNVGCLLFVLFVSNDVVSFLAIQSVFFVIGVIVLWQLTSREMPRLDGHPKIQFSLIYKRAHFSGHLLVISLLAVAMTQLDKIMISAKVPASEFAYFMLAATCANSLVAVVGPVTNALFPNMTSKIAQGDIQNLNQTFHLSCGFVSLITIPVCLVVAFFPENVIWLWSGSQDLVDNLSVFFIPFMIAAMLQATVSLPTHLAYAFNKPHLISIFNCLAATVYLAGTWMLIDNDKLTLIPWLWVTLTGAYVFILIPLVFFQTLKTSFFSWVIQNLLLPVGSSALLLVALKHAVVIPKTHFYSLFILLCSLGCVTLLVLLSNSAVRVMVWKSLRCKIQKYRS